MSRSSTPRPASPARKRIPSVRIPQSKPHAATHRVARFSFLLLRSEIARSIALIMRFMAYDFRKKRSNFLIMIWQPIRRWQSNMPGPASIQSVMLCSPQVCSVADRATQLSVSGQLQWCGLLENDLPDFTCANRSPLLNDRRYDESYGRGGWQGRFLALALCRPNRFCPLVARVGGS